MKPKNLTLGVLGGMGPAATAEFMRIMADKAPAECDQEHPRMIVYSHTITPDRTTFLLNRGQNPSGYIREGLASLVGWGASLLAITCNTAHYYVDQFRDELTVPLVHIVEETMKKAKELSPGGAWLAATLGTMRTGLYQKCADRIGYKLHIPSIGIQESIHLSTDLVKESKAAEAAASFSDIAERLWSEQEIPIIGACTEIPLAYRVAKLPENMLVSSLDALAEASIRELYFG